MRSEGPPVELLTRRLAETPGEFLTPPKIGSEGEIHVDAVVSDLYRDLGGDFADPAALAEFGAKAMNPRRLTMVLIACWALHDEWFRREKRFANAALAFLSSQDFFALASIVSPELFVSDADRREEFARRLLAALDLLPAGENETAARDRLTTLDSVERQRLVRETREAQERIRQVQEAMRKKAAEEAAAAYGRE